MTLKSSSHKQFLAMFRQSMKQTVVLPVLAFICLMFFSVFEFDANYDYQLERYRFFWDEIRLVYGLTSLANICFVLAGVINAMLVFNFTWSKKQTNVIFSLGMSRRDIYFAKLLGGLTPMVCTILIAGFLEVFNCFVCGFGLNARFYAMAALVVLQFIAVYTLAFVLSSAVMSNTGNVVEALTFTAILAVFTTMAEIFIEYSFWDFTHGASATQVVEAVTNAKFNWSCPFSVFNGYYDSSFMEYYFKGDYKLTLNHWSGTICSFAYSAAIIPLGYLGFRKRRNEISGTWGRAKVMNEIVSSALGFYSATICAFGFGGTLHGDGGFYTFMIAVVAFLVAILIFRLIFGYKRKKEIKCALKHFPAYAVGFAAFFAVFSTGLFGYSSYIPEKSEIASVTVTSPHLIFMEDSLSNTSDFALKPQNLRESFIVNPSSFGQHIFHSFYYFEQFTGLIFSKDEDIEKVLKLHEKLIEDGKIKNNAPDAVGTYITVNYTLKDGSTVKRYYSESTEDTILQLLYLNDTKSAKDALHDYANIDLDLERYRKYNSGEYSEETYEGEEPFYSSNNDYLAIDDFLYISHNGGSYNFSKASHIANACCYLFPKDMSGAHSIGLVDEELYRAILTDMKNITTDQYYHHSAADELGIISFGLSESAYILLGENDEVNAEYSGKGFFETSWNLNSDDVKTVVVTKDMKNTVRYLEENDLMKYFEARKTVDDINHIKLATMSELYGRNNNSSNFPVFYSAYWTGEQMNMWMKNYGGYINFPFDDVQYKITEKNKIQSLLNDSVVYGFCSNKSKIMEITYNDGSVSTVLIPAGSASIK